MYWFGVSWFAVDLYATKLTLNRCLLDLLSCLCGIVLDHDYKIGYLICCGDGLEYMKIIAGKIRNMREMRSIYCDRFEQFKLHYPILDLAKLIFA